MAAQVPEAVIGFHHGREIRSSVTGSGSETLQSADQPLDMNMRPHIVHM